MTKTKQTKTKPKTKPKAKAKTKPKTKKTVVAKAPEIKDEFSFQKKAKLVRRELANSIGIVALVGSSATSIIKCQIPLLMITPAGVDGRLYISGVSNSINTNRKVANAVHSVQYWVEEILHARDFNLGVVLQRLADYFERNFYDEKKERPMATELLLVQLEKGDFGCALLKYNGEVVIPKLEKNDYFIFGCTDEKKKNEITGVLKNFDFKKGSVEKLQSILKKKLKDFPGQLMINGKDVDD